MYEIPNLLHHVFVCLILYIMSLLHFDVTIKEIKRTILFLIFSFIICNIILVPLFLNGNTILSEVNQHKDMLRSYKRKGKARKSKKTIKKKTKTATHS